MAGVHRQPSMKENRVYMIRRMHVGLVDPAYQAVYTMSIGHTTVPVGN
jgi:hypothetical protein